MELLQNILYINLGYRLDRNDHCIAEFNKLGLKDRLERFPAIQTTAGNVGCTMSHIKCLELAKSRGYEQIFICEDDIEFTNPTLFLENLEKFQKSRIEWDVLVIGGNTTPPFQKVSDFCIRVLNVQTTTGYIVKRHYYDVLINNFKEGLQKLLREPNKSKEYAIDIYWKRLQHINAWFMIIPLTVCQYYDFSDIEGKVVDYKGMMLDLEKKALIEHYMKLEEEKNRFKMNL